eukprot:COSAG01_NODE_6348_length_3721_cov_1.293208_3_plen_134_part_00
MSLFIRHVPSVMPHLGSVTGAAASSKPTATPVAVTVVVTVVVVPFAVVVVVVVVVVVGIVVGASLGHCAATAGPHSGARGRAQQPGAGRSENAASMECRQCSRRVFDSLQCNSSCTYCTYTSYCVRLYMYEYS